MKYKTTLLIMYAVCIALSSKEQSKPLTCESIHDGLFFLYIKSSGTEYKIIRQDTLQREINLTTNDTSYWKIQWVDKCTLTANYISGGADTSKELKSFLLNHKSYMQFLKVTPEFDLVRLSLDSLTSKRAIMDTLWVHKRQK